MLDPSQQSEMKAVEVIPKHDPWEYPNEPPIFYALSYSNLTATINSLSSRTMP